LDPLPQDAVIHALAGAIAAAASARSLRLQGKVIRNEQGMPSA
jgi:hypothetical protein